jgi:sRNA-binding carbon storage regulator CsrA
MIANATQNILLRRKAGESIVIPDAQVRITLNRTSTGQATIRVETPLGCMVFREESLSMQSQEEHS